MEASIQEVARLTGTTSRTLRHYDAIGLLEPSRVGDNGYRWYDDRELVRLQRILLLRGLGLGLPDIRRVLEREQDETAALRHHLDWLRSEQRRLERQAASVERTITARENGGPLVAENMFDGFDHTQYKDEVEQRWGKDAYASSDAWWRGMSDDERAAWKATTAQLRHRVGRGGRRRDRPRVRRGAGARAAARRVARRHPGNARARHARR